MNLPDTYSNLRKTILILIASAIILDLISDSWGLPLFSFLFFVIAFQLAIIFLTPYKDYLTVAIVHFIGSFIAAVIYWWIIDFGMGPGFGPAEGADMLYPAVGYIGVVGIIALGVTHLIVAMKKSN